MNDSAEIDKRVAEFLAAKFPQRYDPDQVIPLRGDASTRRYFRFRDDDQSYVLAAYPDLFDPEDFNYRQIHDLLQEIALPVPKILALDPNRGIVLQEDLGDESLLHRLAVADAPQRKTLLLAAIDHVVTIQGEGTRALRPEYRASELAFDQEKLNWELRFFRRHYLGDHRHLKPDEDQLGEEFDRLAAELAGLARCLCHRDYMVRNLMIKNNRVYITDFQDARWGPFSYDLASLLKDSIDLAEEEVEEYRDYYLSRGSFPGDSRDFLRQFQLMSIHRLLKALGTFGYQMAVRGNEIYGQYVPGSLRRALDSLQSVPEFPYIQSIIEKELEP